MNHLGEVAREVRVAMGFSQKEAALKLGVTSVYLCNIEKGKALPSHAFLQKYEVWTGVDLYVAAWCRKADFENLPKSVKGIAQQLSEIWQSSIDNLTDGKSVTSSKTKTSCK